MTTELMEREEVRTPEGAERTRARRTFIPPADIYETADAIVVLADMPGVDENSVDITLEKNILTIDGRVEPEQREGYTLTYAEYSVGDYHRVFVLSDAVDRNRIDATVRNGVLKLTLPKSQEAKARKIAVKAE